MTHYGDHRSGGYSSQNPYGLHGICLSRNGEHKASKGIVEVELSSKRLRRECGCAGNGGSRTQLTKHSHSASCICTITQPSKPCRIASTGEEQMNSQTDHRNRSDPCIRVCCGCAPSVAARQKRPTESACNKLALQHQAGDADRLPERAGKEGLDSPQSKVAFPQNIDQALEL